MQIHNILKSQKVNNNTVGNFFKNLYDSHIRPNLFVILVVIIIILLLLIRYVTYKKQKKINSINENYEVTNGVRKYGNPSENIKGYDDLFNELSFDQIKHLIKSEQPSVDPTKSVDNQNKEYTNYPPEKLPINLNDGNGITLKKNIYPDPPNFENLNTPNYNYEAAHYNPRAYYHGTYNTYRNSVDTVIPNPIGLPVNFNTSTEQFVKYATDENNNNVNMYQSILDNKEYNMTNNFYNGRSDRVIDPPYTSYLN